MSDNYHGNRNASLEDLQDQDRGGPSNALTLSTVAELPSPSSPSHFLSNHSNITQPGLDQVFGDTVVDPREAIDEAWSFSNPTLTLNQEYSENTPESATNLLASWQESQVSLLPDFASTTTSFLELLEGDYEGSLLNDEIVIHSPTTPTAINIFQTPPPSSSSLTSSASTAINPQTTPPPTTSLQKPLSKRHPCPYPTCPKHLATSGSLKEHFRTHTNDRPFHCHICSKSYTTKNRLTVHVRDHTEERPYACDVRGCGYASKQKCGLTSHVRRHWSREEKRAFKMRKKRGGGGGREDGGE